MQLLLPSQKCQPLLLGTPARQAGRVQLHLLHFRRRLLQAAWMRAGSQQSSSPRLALAYLSHISQHLQSLQSRSLM